MLSTALILSGFASIPRLLTMKPKNFPAETSKAHLVGFNFILVDISKINAESSFSICFFDVNYVSQPVGVIHLPDNSGLEEFAKLFVDHFLPL